MCLTAVLLAVTTQAATFAVESTANTPDANPGDGLCADSSGACTLRAALREANAGGSADEIRLPEGNFLLPPPVFSPWSGENPILFEDLTITGVGAGRTRLNGSLEVGMCIFACGGPTVRIRQLAIIGPADGTAIVSYGQLVLDPTSSDRPARPRCPSRPSAAERRPDTDSRIAAGESCDRGDPRRRLHP